MGRAKTQLERNVFVRGLITEANPLTFPENASIDEINFVLNRDGSRQRRLGMTLEQSGIYNDTGHAPLTFDSFNISTFKWDNVANKPTISLGVVQVGYNLYFIDLFANVLSSNIKNSGSPFVLNSSSIGYNISGNTLMDFAAIDGKLVITSSELSTPILIEYNDTADTFSATAIDIEVRDIWGLDDGLAVDERPDILTDTHKYNLLNQGWPTNRIIDLNASETVTEYPSNADIVHFGKKSDGGFDATLITGSYLGTTPAAKGKYVISAFNRGADRSAESGIGGLPLDSESGTLSTVTSYAGRIFYSGVTSTITDGDGKSPNYAGTIFFTQVIENEEDFGQCYQVADPTSEDISDLVATDGGTIKIPEAGNILRLIRKDASLVVIADNGVWQITGPDDVFRADDYSITQISNVGCISKGSVVLAESVIMYWSDAGIYILQPDQVSGRLAGQNITETSIQSFYNDIPTVGRANAVSNFDAAGRKISWLFNDTDDYDGVDLRKKYNKELIFDTVLQAFYVHEIQDATTNSPFVAGYMPTQVFLTADNVQQVVHNGEQVQVNLEDVVITETVRTRGVSQTKYLVFKPNQTATNYGISFGQYRNSDFLDWDETDAAGYLVAGHEIFQDSQRSKQANYLTVHCLRTETGFTDTGGGNLEAVGQSSCKIQAQWDFANSANSGKWGTQFEAYRLKRPYYPTGAGDTFDYGWEVITTKNRLRGSGRALSLRFDTSPGKDLYLLGWAYDMDGQTNV